MPIYEYECPSHGRYEVSQRITDAALTTCTQPDCTLPVRKLISHSSFALKGSGWYVTDFKGSGGKPAAKADTGAPKADGAAKPSEAKTEAAAPAKTESAAGSASS